MGLQVPDALITQQADGRVYIPVENSWAVSGRLQPGTSLGAVTHFQLTEPVEEAEIHLVEHKCSVGRRTELLEVLHLEQSSATEEEIQQLEQLVRENSDVFALDNSELGHTDVVQHFVDTGSIVLSSKPSGEFHSYTEKRLLN